MLFIGITIHEISFKDIKPSKDMAAVFFGRFILSPFVVLVVSHFFPIPTLMRNVFVIQAAMPVMTQVAIITKTYDGDSKYAAVMVTVTTIACLLFIPIYMIILNNI
jgi:predicted permease